MKQIDVMKQALEALKRLKAYGNVFRFRQDEQNPYDQACKAIAILRTAIEQAERQQALDKKAENARELGLDYEPVPWIEKMTIDSTNELSKPTTLVQEPVARVHASWNDDEGFMLVKRTGERLSVGTPLYTTPQPKREFVGLTDEEFTAIVDQACLGMYERTPRAVAVATAHATEAKLREKNT